jgi:hypothetical protein
MTNTATVSTPAQGGFDELDGGVRRAGRHVAAGEPRRIAVFVVDVDEQSEPLALLGGELPEAEPVLAEVLGHQPRARVDEHAAHALLLELRELFLESRPGVLIVPHPQRHGAELGRRIGEVAPDLLGRVGSGIRQGFRVEQQVALRGLRVGGGNDE